MAVDAGQVWRRAGPDGVHHGASLFTSLECHVTCTVGLKPPFCCVMMLTSCRRCSFSYNPPLVIACPRLRRSSLGAFQGTVSYQHCWHRLLGKGRGSNIDAFRVEAALKTAGVAGRKRRRAELFQGVGLRVYMRDQNQKQPPEVRRQFLEPVPLGCSRVI